MKIVVVGAGPGGYVSAIRAAQLGAKVTIIEDTEVGGTCLNRGCIPTKAIIASTDVLDKIRDAEEFGFEIKGDISFSLKKIMERKEKVVNTLVKGIKGLFKGLGIELLEGKGRLFSPGKVKATLKDGTDKEVDADKIIIATGSRPLNIPAFPFDGERILSSDDVLKIKEVPKSLIIIGAGVIGCEFANIFRSLDTEITIVEMMPHAVSTEDEEISEILGKELKKRKIKLILNTKVEKVIKENGGVVVTLTDGSEIRAEKMLVSIGRAFNTEGIGLEEVGINKGRRGEILVNDMMETNIPGIYAIGDVVGGIMLAHVASTEGMVAVENALGGNRVMDYRVVPSGIFTSPEIGSVGLREKDTSEKGYNINIGRFPFRALGKAHASGEITGMVKIIADAKDDKVLGVHIIGPHATDLIHEAALAMKMGTTARDIAHTVHAHPTFSEAIMEASEDVHGMAIHIPKKS
ncbi:MAG: dihydrolipoyl dehydrogenase [Nitrospirae bacterium]|nr:dihydrolipoyl dehydrogenase [Nitrospirota bacterium]